MVFMSHKNITDYNHQAVTEERLNIVVATKCE